LRYTSRILTAAAIALSASTLSACFTIDAMLAAPSAEVGNTYMLNGPKMFCTPERETCSSRFKGNFTVDGAMVLASKPIALIHIIFDDGHGELVSYSAFAEEGFGPPVETRRKVKHGMSPTEIKATWGPPDASAPETKNGLTFQVWTYNGVGRIKFLDDKVIDVELKKSLLALE